MLLFGLDPTRLFLLGTGVAPVETAFCGEDVLRLVLVPSSVSASLSATTSSTLAPSGTAALGAACVGVALVALAWRNAGALGVCFGASFDVVAFAVDQKDLALPRGGGDALAGAL